MAAAVVAGCGGNTNEGPPPGAEMAVSAILAEAVKEPVRDIVKVVGSLSARDEVTILSELDSTVVEVAVKEGRAVEKGAVLFRLDDVKTAAMLSDAEAAHQLAEISYKRSEGLLKNNTISQQAHDEARAALKSAKAQLELAGDQHFKTVITAPFSGVVGEKSVSIGQFVTRGRLLLSMVRMDPLDIVGDAPERYLAGLSTNLAVEFETEAYPRQTFKASIVYVSPTVDASSRTVRIKAEVPNAEGLLKPGMFGRMSIILEERDDSLLIPEACIRMQGPRMMVVRLNGENRSEVVPVTTGRRSEGRVEVLTGISEGDRVVVEGWQKTAPGTLVTAAPGSEAYGVPPDVPAEAGK
jgi:membrane fusion protein (multidrug efflux system)